MWTAGVFKPVLWWGGRGGGSWLIDQSWVGWSGVRSQECCQISQLVLTLLQSRLFLAKRPWELWRVNTEPGLRPVNILLPPQLPPPPPPPLRAQPMSGHCSPRYSPHQFHFQSWYLLAGRLCSQVSVNTSWIFSMSGRKEEEEEEEDDDNRVMSTLIFLSYQYLGLLV